MDFLSEIPLIGGIFDDSDEKAIDLMMQNQQFWKDLQVPEHEWTKFNPEQYYYEGDVNSQLVDEDPLVRSAQMALLSKMAGMADSGMDSIDEAMYTKARNEAGQMAKAGSQAALNNAASRGAAGSGLEFAMREIANQGSVQRAQNANLAQAADKARQRQLWNQAYGNMLGDVRGQDYRTNSANTDIINKFNTYNTANRQNMRNMNTQQANDAFKYNQDGRINTQQQNFNNQVTRGQGMNTGNANLANAYAAQNSKRAQNRNKNTELAAMFMMGGG